MIIELVKLVYSHSSDIIRYPNRKIFRHFFAHFLCDCLFTLLCDPSAARCRRLAYRACLGEQVSAFERVGSRRVSRRPDIGKKVRGGVHTPLVCPTYSFINFLILTRLFFNISAQVTQMQ